MRRGTSLRTFRAPALALVSALGCGVATAEVVAVVSARNPVTTLSGSQIADIFLGKSARFPDGSAAVPIDQAEGSAPREAFYIEFAGKTPAQLNAHWSKIIFTGRGQAPAEMASGAEVRKRVAENPRAIGYLDRSSVDSGLKVLAVP